jgi:hypothetical protein
MDREKLEELRTRTGHCTKHVVWLEMAERDALFAYIDELEQRVKALDPYSRGVVSQSETF